MGNGLGRQRKGTQTREGNGRANAIKVHYARCDHAITQSVLCTVNTRKADKTDKTEIFGAWRRLPRPL